MRDLSADELTSLRAFAEATMQDECYIMRRSRTYSASSGEPVETYTADASAVACGFEPTGNTERWRGVVAVTDVDARLRLPFGTAIDDSCHVQVTQRHGQAVTAETYDVVSEPRTGPSGIVCDLKRVEL